MYDYYRQLSGLTVTDIIIEGATKHNLCNIDVHIARHAITIISGVSGAGKSTLVRHVLLSEAQRRFFNTMSLHTRKLVHGFSRPAAKAIRGLSPALVLPQAAPTPPASTTVGGATDISELWRILFATQGKKHCPRHQLPMQAYTPQSIGAALLATHPNATVVIAAPLAATAFRTAAAWQTLQHQHMRVIIDNELQMLEDCTVPPATSTVSVVIDIIKISTGCETRLRRSIEQALHIGQGCCLAARFARARLQNSQHFALTSSCPRCNFTWPALEAQHFRRNCSACQGKGKIEAQHCSACAGSGLPKDLHAITIAGYSLPQIRNMSIDTQQGLVRKLLAAPQLDQHGQLLLRQLRRELLQLQELGLDYLTTAQHLGNLSSGEWQKIRIATLLNEDLNGVIYIFDEPSQGLATSEIEQLWQQFVRLKQRGNTIIIVDHSRVMLEKADYIIDLGPGGGEQGGKLLARFNFATRKRWQQVSPTAAYLCRRPPVLKNEPLHSSTRKFLHIWPARVHNLQIEKVRLRKHALNIVTGVAGAGKSSLVEHCLYRVLQQRLRGKSSHARQLDGGDDFRQVYFVARTPLPSRQRSMIATQLGIFTWLRQLFGQLKESQIAGFSAADFALTAARGGRCPTCQGLGTVAASVAYLPATPCHVCNGRRYDSTIDSITWRGLSISAVLALSINAAAKFLRNFNKVHTILQVAVDLGLGHLQLGRATAQLSSGESQRLQLVPCVAKTGPDTLLLLDAPGRGLHSNDIVRLVQVLYRLRAAGTTLVLIEHNTELIAASDWLVQLGPGGGQYGGRLLYEGTPR